MFARKSITLLLNLAVRVCFFLVGHSCKTSYVHYRNMIAPKASQILLESGGLHENTWQT